MSYSFEYIDIILLAMIAGFIFLRLRGILGKRTGFDGKTPAQFKEVLKNMKVEQPKKSNDVFDTLAQEEFLKGAKIAYETIITSLAKGDKIALRPLLNKNIYQSFSDEIDKRNKENLKSELTFVGVKSAKIKNFETVYTSSPSFLKIMKQLGAKFEIQ